MASHGTAGSLDFDDVLSLSSTVYARVSSELVHSSLDLGKHALIVNKPQQDDHGFTAVDDDDQHVRCGGEDAQHLAQRCFSACRKHQPALSSSTLFCNLMSHINCRGTITQEAWHKQFGVISDDFPWGVDFWHGFSSLMATHYLPRSRLRHTCIEAYVPHWFTLPMNFSEAAAFEPKTQRNPPSNNKYPCFVLSYTYGHPKYDMVCIHQGLLFVRHWKVDITWLETASAVNRG